jgi:hypothetical protein
MIAATVLKEFLSMIGREGKDRVIPATRLA